MPVFYFGERIERVNILIKGLEALQLLADNLLSLPAIIPKAPWRIVYVCHLPGFKLSVRFNDGREGTVAMAGLIHSPNAGVFAALQDEELFSKVSLHYGAVTWPGELDLAPDAMYEAICRSGEYVL